MEREGKSESTRLKQPTFGAGKAKLVPMNAKEKECLMQDKSKLLLKIEAAKILELLAKAPHAAALIAQGGLLAAVAALEWNIDSRLSTSCAKIVLKLADEQQAYLQMVCSSLLLCYIAC